MVTIANQTPLIGNGQVQRLNVEESTRYKWVKIYEPQHEKIGLQGYTNSKHPK